MYEKDNTEMYLTDKTNNIVYLDIYKSNISKYSIYIFYLLMLKIIFHVL